MKIVMQNIGALRNAEIEPKPLTIICGKNNTGKTYAMYAMWGVVNIGARVELDFLDELVQEVKQKGQVRIDIVNFFEENFEKVLQTVNLSLNSILPRVFNAPESYFESSLLSISATKQDFIDFLNSESSYADDSTLINGFFDIILNEKEKNIEFKKKIDDFPDFVIVDVLSTFLVKVLFSFIGKSAFLMPTERAGLNLFFNEIPTQKKKFDNYIIARNKKEKLLNIDLEAVWEQSYAEPIEDYVDFLRSRKLDYGFTGKFSEIINNKSRDFVGNGFKKDKGNVFFKTSDGHEISLHMASSAIKTNFALWAYLNGKVSSNDFLMIDEPELNLHPDAQRSMARMLVNLVNSGLKVAVSTHSDYFIREINTLIMLNNEFSGKAELMEKYHYHKSDLLDMNKVVAYHFSDGTACPMPIDKNYGIEAETFDEVINSMNEAYSEIHYALSDNLSIGGQE